MGADIGHDRAAAAIRSLISAPGGTLMRPAFLTRSLGLLTTSTLLSGSVASPTPSGLPPGSSHCAMTGRTNSAFSGRMGFCWSEPRRH